MTLNVFDLFSNPVSQDGPYPVPTPRPDILPQTMQAPPLRTSLLPQRGPIPTLRPITDADIVAVEPASRTSALSRPLTDADMDALGAPGITDADIVAVEPLPANAPSENSFAGNVARGAGQRAAAIAGNLIRAAGTGIEAAGDYMEQKLPLGRIEIGSDGIRHVASTPEDVAADSEIGRGAKQAAKTLTNVDLGYKPQTTWEDFKAAPLKSAVPFIVEQGLVSAPDMAAAMLNPALYTASMTGEMGQNRAQNDLRDDATVGDLISALPSAAAFALMERFGAHGALGLGDAAVEGLKQVPKAVGKAAAKEGGTEFAQESLQNATETTGTKKGFDPMQAAEQGLQGAIVGAGIGGGLRAPGATVEGLAHRSSPEARTQPGPEVDDSGPETRGPEAPALETQGPTRTTPDSFTPDPEPGAPPVPEAPGPEAHTGTEQVHTGTEQVQTAPAPEGVPFVMTNDTRQKLAAMGYTPEQIRNMTPGEANGIVSSSAPAPQPAPIAQGPDTSFAPKAPETKATSERVVTPDGEREIDTDFDVVEADQLRAAEGQLQPRDRAGRVGSDLQVQRIASQLDPLRLASSRESDRGAPIIDDDNVILSGNGRTAAIMQAAQSNPQGYDAYRQHLASLGFDTEGMNTPVLVRRAKGITPEDKRRFAVRSNSEGGLSLSPTERAGIERDYVTPDMLAGFDADAEGGVASASNRAFVQQFLRNVPANEQAAFYNSDRMLTPAGAKRIAGAMFARAYGDKNMIERFVEDENDPAIRNALTGAAGAWARMRDTVGAGPLDVTKDLVEAVNIVNRARSAGTSLDNSLSQIDAFSQPSPRAVSLARLFYAPGGKRLAAWRDVRDRLMSYADQAERTGNATGDLLGGEGPTPESILSGIQQGVDRRGATDQQPTLPVAAKQAAPEGDGELFSGSEVLSKGPKRGKAAAEPEGALLDRAANQNDDDDEFDPDDDGWDDFLDAGDNTTGAPVEDRSRVARGSMTPGMEQVSFSQDRSVYEEVFKAAGIDPDKGVLLPPARKMQVLKQVLQKTFGIAVDLNVKGKPIAAPDAINQMMDAYRNVRFMLHALDLPLQGLGLGGRLTLALEKFKGQYLGAYDPASHTIHMPGRSNSFAHEWAHALDHYLVDALKPGSKGLFSQVARNEGLDPNQSLDAAFVNLVHKMFFNEADLAVQIMRLEQQAAQTTKAGPNEGQPTAAAIKAREQAERLAAGATRIKIQPSNYRQNSKDFDPGNASYYGSVHEMLARAFEAWIGSKVKALGGSNEFITKGDEAYLSDADRRLAMTFPKLGERAEIFGAFEDLFHHIRNQSILGTGPAAERPTDEFISDPMHWHKQVIGIDHSLLRDAKAEMIKAKNIVKNIATRPRQTLRDGVSEVAANAGLTYHKGDAKSFRVAAADMLRMYTYASGGYMRVLARRNKGKGGSLLDHLVGKMAPELGSGREQAVTYDEEWQRFLQSSTSRVEDTLKGNGFPSLKFTEAENNTVRDLMFGKDVPGADPKLVKVAAEFRRVYDDMYQHARKNGVEFGYVTDKGYLQRVLQNDKVQQDPDAFQRDAEKVYGVVFDDLFGKMADTDERARAAVGMAFTLSRSSKWGNPNPLGAPRTSGPFAGEIKGVTKARKAFQHASAAAADPTNQTAGQEADDAETRFEQAVESLIEKIREPYMAHAAYDWRENIVAGKSNAYDSHGPATQFTKSRTLPDEADDILSRWYETDVPNLLASYAMHVGKKSAYQARFGNVAGNSEFDAVVARKEVQYQIRSNPARYNTRTEAGRLNVIRDLANPRVDNLKELALKTAAHFGAFGPDIREIRGIIENQTGNVGPGSASPVMRMANRLSHAIYTYTYLRLLPRAAWASLAEPVTFYLRTGDGKNTLRMFAETAREMASFVKSSDRMQERAAFARAIGLVANEMSDVNMLNRMASDEGTGTRGGVMLLNFFRKTGLTQLTDAQRRAGMAAGFYWMRDLAKTVRDQNASGTKREIARAEFRDLGVPDRHIDAMTDWLMQSDDHPGLDDLRTPLGQMYGHAVSRFVDTVIQNPRRADKPLTAVGPLGRLVYSLTSFLYKFADTAYVSNVRRAKRNFDIAKDEGASLGGALMSASSPLAVNMLVGMSSMFAAQLAVTVAREAIFNSDVWDEKDRDGELESWLTQLAWSRTGVFGPADTIQNALTGLRYERDLASLGIGAGLASIMSDFQNIINGLPTVENPFGGYLAGARNSPKTNTAEHQKMAALYRLVLAPALNLAMSAVGNSGPIGWTASHAAMTAGSSPQFANTFADWTAGEKIRRGGNAAGPYGQSRPSNPFTGTSAKNPFGNNSTRNPFK
jgi:hypothetical protein